ncbi:FAD/NAD(P)-binding protein [Streptomyces sp. NPDC047046]|uniref:FAD/NAD(P)-binding protein n=1 Tax=Streptomyces sp. NPDC047046 TaxID=3155378 RepID=UPI0033E8D1CC
MTRLTDRPRPTPAAQDLPDDPYRIVVVGTGPRGLAALERLAVHLTERPPGRPVEIHAIDDHQVGPGRVWRPGQSPLLLMNTVAGDVTMFSGPPDGPARPGAGPSLAQWWGAADGVPDVASACAPRAVYGRYLAFVFDTVRGGLPEGVSLHPVTGRVERMRRPAGLRHGWTLALADGRELWADRVLLSTGHGRPLPSGPRAAFAGFAARHGLPYIEGDSAADLPLERVPAGATVGVMGLGMAFYDVMVLLTEGRGGRFEPCGEGLRYLPGGQEPVLVAGSRGGVPMPARGVNQKRPDYTYTPRLFTFDRVRDWRAAGRIDFEGLLLPWLRAELGLVHHATAIRRREGAAAARSFTEQAVRSALVDTAGAAPDLAVAREAAAHGCADARPVDLHGWARPFATARFDSAADYQQALTGWLETDLACSLRGNLDDPLKATVELLRVLRHIIRTAVGYGGLTPRSHEGAFLKSFAPWCAQLSSGPPVFRLRQTLALMRAGVLRVVGPGTRFAADPGAGRFTASSPQVAGPPELLDGLIDARVPPPDVRTDASPLIRDLLGQKIITSYVNTWEGEDFDTGGLRVTEAPFHPVGAHGAVHDDVHVSGIPLENVRWFTQVGSGRAGGWSDFHEEADAIARAMAAAAVRVPVTAVRGDS